MKAILSRLSVLLVLAGCAAAPAQEQDQTQQPADQQPAQPAAPAPVASGCAAVQPWNLASTALGKPVVAGTGAGGKSTYRIKRVSYAEIIGDRDLTEGVQLTDQSGRVPPPNSLFDIVWTSDGDSTDSTGKCTTRYSAPTFLDVR